MPPLPPPSRSLASAGDRKSTRLNSSHLVTSYAVFCLKKQVAVHREVVLPVGVVDLRGGEQRVHAEGAGLVGDDRHPALAGLLVVHEDLQQASERNGGG